MNARKTSHPASDNVTPCPVPVKFLEEPLIGYKRLTGLSIDKKNLSDLNHN
jgi:hypothetical protein